MCVYMYVDVCMCVYIYTYISTSISLSLYIYMYIYIYIYLYTYTQKTLLTPRRTKDVAFAAATPCCRRDPGFLSLLEWYVYICIYINIVYVDIYIYICL